MTPLEQWTQRLSQNEMPVLARTAQEVSNAAERETSSIAEIANLVLKDSSMTARVLKLANSSFYKPAAGQQINTISRAVLILGFDAVRSLCLSVALINTMLRDGNHRDRVIRKMAHAFHAAVQAREIAVARGIKSPEEVYVATLLYHLGEMAFWCFGAETADELAERLEEPDVDPGEAEADVLGFRLSRLTLALNKEWKLTPLLNDAIEGRGDPRVRDIRLGVELAEKADLGWDHAEVRKVIEKIAKITEMSFEKAEEIAHESAKHAAEVAHAYGAPGIGRLIPTAGPQIEAEEEPIEEAIHPEDFLQPDPMLQLHILRDIAAQLTSDKPDINLLFSMALEGIHRGIGMDRTVLALLAPDRKSIRAKYTLGWGQNELMQSFHFTAFQERDLFSEVMETRQPLWFRNEKDEADHITSHVRSVLGETPFFIAPLVAQGRAIGLIYSDRRQSRRGLDEESFNSFKSFAQQANLGLALLQPRR